MCTSCENIQTDTATDARTESGVEAGVDVCEVTVHGMTCSSCASKVSAAVGQVAGVTGTEVDLATGTLRARGADVDQDAVRGAITAIGYQVA